MANLETIRSAPCHGGTGRLLVWLGSDDSSYFAQHGQVQLDGWHESGRVHGGKAEFRHAKVVGHSLDGERANRRIS